MKDTDFIVRWAGVFGVQCSLHVGAGHPVWHIDTGGLVLETAPALTQDIAQEIHADVVVVLKTHQPGEAMTLLLGAYARRLQQAGDARGSGYIRRLQGAVDAANAGAAAAIHAAGSTGGEWMEEE